MVADPMAEDADFVFDAKDSFGVDVSSPLSAPSSLSGARAGMKSCKRCPWRLGWVHALRRYRAIAGEELKTMQ